MDGDSLELIRRLDTTDRLVLMLHWADGCTAHEISRLLSMDLRRVIGTIERIRALASESLAVTTTTGPGAIQGRPRPPVRHR